MIGEVIWLQRLTENNKYIKNCLIESNINVEYY